MRSSITQGLRTISANHRLFTAASIAVFAASFTHVHFISIVLVTMLVAHTLSGFARRLSRFDALLALVFGALTFAFLIQLTGELVGPWATSGPATSAALIVTLWFGCERRTTWEESPAVSTWRAVLVALPFVAMTFAVMSMSVANRVTVLGYGYDNAAHLAQGRVILHEGGSLLLSGGSQAGPSFVQDSAQVGGTLLATAARLAGLDGQATAGLTAVLLIITISLPAILALSVFAIARDGDLPRSISFTITATVSVALFGTYLSRIWFSGYFASNLGTLGLALLVAYLTRPAHRDPFIAMVLVIVCGHTYTIFLFVAATIALPVVISDLRTQLFGSHRLAPTALAWRSSLVGVAVLTLILPYIATSRSFSSDQFLADGGIERIPLPWVVAFVAVASAPLFIQTYRALRPAFAAMCALIVAVSIGIARYSIGEKGYVSYYPTKIIIAMAICMVFAAVTLFSSLSRRRRDFPVAFISLAALVAIVIPQKQGTVFTTAYMGRMREVLPRLLDPVPLTVNGAIDVDLADVAEERQTPVLLMSHLYESELNSRWINVLARTWTDESWTGWMVARTQLGDTATPPPITDEAPLIVATDSANDIATAESQGFDVCSIVDYSTVATLEC